MKIVSGGQTGADRAALDIGIELGLPVGGWVPKGGWAEDCPQPPGLLTKYPQLWEADEPAPQGRTRLNVRDSDATLILVKEVMGESIPWHTAYTGICARTRTPSNGSAGRRV